MTPESDPHIDIERLLSRLAELSEIGGIDETTGCSRLAFTDADRAGRELVLTWMRDLGLEVTVDGIGNVVGVWRPDSMPEDARDLAPVMTGSHIDTVATGGRYDGNLGVLAGIEVIETLATEGFVPPRPLAVAFFSNEEGARFAPDMMGSLVYVGGMGLEQAHNTVGIDGATVGEELDRIGYRGPAPCPGLVPHAFVELHIEQGPVLEEAGIDVGVVEGVQGISWTEVTIEGQSNHAGTTPMRLRHDAGFAAASVATFVRSLARELGHPQVGTVGAIDLHPNLVNVVAASATLTVDLRNTDNGILTGAEQRLHTHLDELATTEGVAVSTRSLARFDPVVFDSRVVDLVEAAARSLGATTLRMPSGAGHDAQMMARVCPTAMIFTPSHKGISHNPAEHTDPDHLAVGADTLLQVMLDLAGGGWSRP
ncbi:MAG: Zn-dependent hydrolase [Acidimicrobiia bacterium]|nr:Zn-dependent hydrolase [Acidimicrobiia bacterium]